MTVVSGKLGNLKTEISLWGNLVKFSHSIFALPFAMAMFLVVARFKEVNLNQLFWILAALISARTAAMAFNRILDRHLDALNPRTQNRELPSSKISCLKAWRLTLISSALFVFSSWMLGLHCLYLSFPVLGFLFFYSYTKRFTSYAHVILGIALALAPGGVWYALTDEFAFLPVVMMLAVMFWVAGFDIIYSCQDIDFDRSNSLFSIPALLGSKKALYLSRIFHIITLLLLTYFGFLNSFGVYYYSALIVFALLLWNQHTMVSPNDLSKADAAFFTRNGAASFIYFIGILLEFLTNYSAHPLL